MRCPSCGAIAHQHSMQCSECGAIQDKESADFSEQFQSSQTDIVEEPVLTNTTQKAQPARSLIEFPGVTRSVIPQWRKELGERVREVQERRAREVLLESGLDEPAPGDDESRTPLLELLPRAEIPPVNPIVAAALQRIERAHTQPRFSGNAAVALVAYDEQAEFELEIGPSTEDGDPVFINEEPDHASARSEKVHNLAVVPPQIPTQGGTPMSASMDIPTMDNSEVTEPIRKPKRLILGDLNDPALNYLDSIPVAICVDIPQRRSAPIGFRFLSGILDLAFVCLLSSPVLALLRLANIEWWDTRALLFAFGTLIVMGFLYFTISTAFTGRTLGMKAFSLRVVDARTGLIPTGGQSATRALIYMLSLASAGIALMYAFLDSDRHSAHDRFARTVVVRV